MKKKSKEFENISFNFKKSSKFVFKFSFSYSENKFSIMVYPIPILIFNISEKYFFVNDFELIIEFKIEITPLKEPNGIESL